MATLVCSKVTIGGPPYQTENYLYIDYSTVDSASTNQTTVYWHAYFHFTYADARLYDLTVNVNGERIRNTGVVHSYGGNFTTRNIDFGGGNFVVDHNSSGEASIGISGSVNVDGIVSSGSTTLTLSNYNRSANVPYFDNITRDGSNQSHFYTHFARTGNVQNGTTTYSLERATNQAMTENFSNFSEGDVYDFDQYKAYWFRMYAIGNEGGWVRSNGGNGDGTWGPYYGRPTAPTWKKVARNALVTGQIDLEWNTPSNSGNSGYGSLQYYHIYRNGVRIATSQTITGNSFSDTGLTPGTSYYYEIYALGSSYWSPVSQSTTAYLGGTAITAPGTPAAPSTVPDVTTSGRNVTIKTAQSPNDYGLSIQGYKVRYRSTSDPTRNPIIWSSWSTGESMAVDTIDTSKYTKTFALMPPALTYQFQVYAYNSITKLSDGTTNVDPNNYNFSVSALKFVSAGGRRKNPDGTFKPTEYAKRYESGIWKDITTAKRFDASQNKWVDLT
jgi:hypothetical protein